VTATDASWNNITLTGSGLPSGASFPTSQSLTGSTSSSFSWTPSDTQGSKDYKVTFTVDDGHGGKTSSTVTIHVTTINRSSPLNNAVPYFVVALVAGTAFVLSAPLVLRRFLAIVERRENSLKAFVLSSKYFVEGRGFSRGAMLSLLGFFDSKKRSQTTYFLASFTCSC
jgi:hypothetical protein